MQLHIKSLNTKLPFTQAVRCGHFVYVSGQASVDPNTDEIKCGTLAEEMTLSFKNLRAIIESTRAIWAQILKINCFLHRNRLSRIQPALHQIFYGPLSRSNNNHQLLPSHRHFRSRLYYIQPDRTAMMHNTVTLPEQRDLINLSIECLPLSSSLSANLTLHGLRRQ